MTGYVYVIGNAASPKKIGIAADPQKRLHQLRCASPIHLDILFKADVGLGRPRSVESVVHAALAERHIRGEWFDVDLDTAKAAITAAIAAEPPAPLADGDGLAPVQCRMARKMLGISQEELARAAGTSDRTVLAFEKGNVIAYGTVLALRAALEAHGATFIEHDGNVGVLVPKLAA